MTAIILAVLCGITGHWTLMTCAIVLATFEIGAAVWKTAVEK